MQEWSDAKTLRRTLGIARSTLYERVKRGDIEATTIGGKRFYRAAPRPDDQSSSGPEVRNPDGPELNRSGHPDGPEPDGTGLVPAAQVLALVERYETRIDSLLVEARSGRAEHSAERAQLDAQRAQLAGQVEQLRTAAAAAERAQLDAQHARQVEQLRAEQAIAQATQRAAELERRLEALETPWWRWRRRRALLSAVTLIEGGER